MHKEDKLYIIKTTSNNNTSYRNSDNCDINQRDNNRINSKTYNILPKRPIPTPRHIPPTTPNALETNEKISNKQMSSSTFYDASKPELPSKHVSELQKTLTEMRHMQRDDTHNPSEESNILISNTIRDENNLDFDHLPPKVNPSVLNIITPNSGHFANSLRGYSASNIDDEALYSIVDNMAIVYNNDIELQLPFKHHQESADKADVSRSLTNAVERLKIAEKEYLQELIEVKPVYTYGIKHHTSSQIKGSAEVICATVESLLETQTQFGKDLSEAVPVEKVVEQFANHGYIFRIYKEFFKGPGSEITITIADTQTDFEKEISLRTILRHRLLSYKAFFEEIGKHPYIRPLVESCQTIINGALNSDSSSFSVEDSPFDITENYLLKDSFNVSGQFKKGSEQFNSVVFLYTNFILLTAECPADTFYYKAHINMDEISPIPEGKRKKVLKIKDFAKTKLLGRDIVYKLEAATETIQEKWRKKIHKLLEAQNMKHKAEVRFLHASRNTT